MLGTLLAAYAVIALLGVALTTVRMAADRPRKDRYTDRLDRMIVAATAILASAAWPVLLSILAIGWAGSARGRTSMGRMYNRVRLLPAPIFRNRLYGALR
jgi:hypothetical protein